MARAVNAAKINANGGLSTGAALRFLRFNLAIQNLARTNLSCDFESLRMGIAILAIRGRRRHRRRRWPSDCSLAALNTRVTNTRVRLYSCDRAGLCIDTHCRCLLNAGQSRRGGSGGAATTAFTR